MNCFVMLGIVEHGFCAMKRETPIKILLIFSVAFKMVIMAARYVQEYGARCQTGLKRVEQSDTELITAKQKRKHPNRAESNQNECNRTKQSRNKHKILERQPLPFLSPGDYRVFRQWA